MICNGDMGGACMMECIAGTCGQRNNGLLVARPADERLTQLWLIQQSSNQLDNAGKQRSCVPSKAGPWLRQELTSVSMGILTRCQVLCKAVLASQLTAWGFSATVSSTQAL